MMGPMPTPSAAPVRRGAARRPAAPAASPLASGLVAGGGWGLLVALVVHLLAVLMVLVAWVVSPSTQWTAGDSIGIGLRASAMAHGAAVAVGASGPEGETLTLHGGPTVLALVGAWGVWRSVRTLVGRVEAAAGEDVGDDVVLVPAAGVAAGYLVGHALPLLLAGRLGTAGSAGSWVLGLFLVALLPAVVGLVTACSPARRDVWFSDWPGDAGELLQDALAPAGRALRWLAVAGALVVVACLVVRWPQVAAVHRVTGADGGAGVVLTAVQGGWLPTAVGWGTAWLAGPGVVVPSGAFTPGGAPHLALPAVPVLGALPGQGTFSPWWWAVLLVPMAVGAFLPPVARAQAEQFVQEAGTPGVAARALLACALVGIGATALGPLLGVGVAPGALERLHPHPLWGLALAAELAVGVGLRLAMDHLRQRAGAQRAEAGRVSAG